MHGNRGSANITVQNENEQRKNAAARKEDLRLTKMMATIFFAFLACFVPLMLVNVFDDDDVSCSDLFIYLRPGFHLSVSCCDRAYFRTVGLK